MLVNIIGLFTAASWHSHAFHALAQGALGNVILIDTFTAFCAAEPQAFDTRPALSSGVSQFIQSSWIEE